MLQANILPTTLLLFLVLDPLGNIPMFLALLKDTETKRRRKIILRECLVALVVLVMFLLMGRHFLALLNLKTEAVTLAGGLILLLIGLRMLFPNPEGVVGPQTDGEPFIVPLAVPFVAGPSALVSLVLLQENNPGHTVVWLISLLLAWGLTLVVLLGSNRLFRWLGNKGLGALSRLMGMVMITLAVQMVANGVLGLAARPAGLG